MLSRPFRLAYRELIHDQLHRVSFWVLIGFVLTFATARLLVATQPTLFLHIHGIHVHHFTYGIFVLTIAGALALTLPRRPTPYWLSIFYGAGVALSFDEFGMWLRLTDNYHLDQSEDVMVGILVFLVIIVYLLDWLRRAGRHFRAKA